MEIVDNRIILFRTRYPHKYNIIPKHKVFPVEGGYEVAVHWGLDEARVLRNMGVRDVPSPIYGRYDWPGRYTPMTHQKETASFLTLHRRAFVLSEPGTGKTMAALWAADYLMKRGDVRRVLILCPMSIMHSAWMQDIGSSVIHRSAIVAHHSQASRRIEAVQEGHDIVVTNYEGLDLIAKEVKNDGRFDLIIIDEANAYKNPQTKRWKVLNGLLTPNMYLWMMTGTPAPQSPLDAYGLAKLVNPKAVPAFYTAWRDTVMQKLTMFKWAPKPDAAERVHRALQPAIRYTKDQCLDLPPVVTLTREVPLTPQQAKYYNALKTAMVAQAGGETITAVNAAAALNKLLQISCIAHNTPVLTQYGWVPIQAVRADDLVWDGEAFVAHQGLVRRGRKQTAVYYGVRMTPDHEVLTNEGWRPAAACEGLDRADVRLPDCAATTRYERWEEHQGAVVVPLGDAAGANDTREEAVYDIAACGPRNRFVVLGQDRQPLIVHNCGVAYSDNGETVEFDATPRLNVLLEMLEQTERKVLVFALFRSAIETISVFLNKRGVACEEIHGGISATKRGDIIKRFQTLATPRVLVMQPQAAAHGITLTAADTVVFYGPLMSTEQYVQACARADRKGQTSDKVTVVHIQGSPVEKKMFAALASKVDDNRLLVELFKSEIAERGLTTKS